LANILANIELRAGTDRDFVATLKRDSKTYTMLASTLLAGSGAIDYLAQDGDHLTLTKVQARPRIQLEVETFAAQTVTYIRVSSDNDERQQDRAVEVVPIQFQGLDLRQLLADQSLELDGSRDLLIRLTRGGQEYRLSAQSVLLDDPSTRYWLRAGDHIVVQDVPYVDDTALIVGEVAEPKFVVVHKSNRTTLGDGLLESGLFEQDRADYRHVYVFRGQNLSYKAFHFDMTEVLTINLSRSLELRPGDLVFVRTRPISRYNSVINELFNLAARSGSIANQLN